MCRELFTSGDTANALDASPPEQPQQQQQQSAGEASWSSSSNPIIVNAIIALIVVSGLNLVLLLVNTVRCLRPRPAVSRFDVVDFLDGQ